jgi:ABC-type branched-subunit amino acid transport system permease subunit
MLASHVVRGVVGIPSTGHAAFTASCSYAEFLAAIPRHPHYVVELSVLWSGAAVQRAPFTCVRPSAFAAAIFLFLSPF